MSNTVIFSTLHSASGTLTAIGYDFQVAFAELAQRGDADVAIVSTEEGFSPLGGSRKFLEEDLGISYEEVIRPLARWNQSQNEKVTLLALASCRPESLLRGVILAPGANCKSYQSYARSYDPRPNRDYYYNISYEAIAYASRKWGARKFSITHLCSGGQFHPDMATCHAEALAHFCEASQGFEPTSFTFCGCCISVDHLMGIRALNSEGNPSGHRPINVKTEVKDKAVLLHLEWRSS